MTISSMKVVSVPVSRTPISGGSSSASQGAEV